MSRQRSIVPCLTWIKRGVAKLNPDKIQLDKDELKQLIEDAQDKLGVAEDSDDSQEENMEQEEDEEGASAAAATGKTGKKAKAKKKKEKANADADSDNDNVSDDIVDKYGLDDYDDEENAAQSRWSGMGEVANFASSEDDPYITIKGEEDSDDEDTEIKATDNLLVCGRCEGDVSVLEVHVYNEDNNQLYIHHDYLLSSLPLVIEWLNFDGYDNAPGNLVAVGTMDPVIDIWDLDVMESVTPSLSLGAQPQKTKKKKKKEKEAMTGHTQAVLDLSWNKHARHVLASASADTTVALWDLTEAKMATTFTQHSREVQCCKWHPQEQQTLLTGSYDNTVKVVDCRNAEECHKSWTLEGEVEKVVWNHFNPLQFLSCTDQGKVYCVDIRQERPIFTLAAHHKPVTGLSLSSQIPGLLVTTSEDKFMNVWDLQNDQPSLVLSRNLRMRELHCAACCPEAPFVFGVGGDSKEPKVWDIRESAAVRQHFLNRMPSKLAAECEGDDKDLADNDDDDDDEAATAMEGLQMEEDREEESVAAAAAASVSAKKKKKKKKKKAKKTVDRE